jgi:hypothetical protein
MSQALIISAPWECGAVRAPVNSIHLAADFGETAEVGYGRCAGRSVDSGEPRRHGEAGADIRRPRSGGDR